MDIEEYLEKSKAKRVYVMQHLAAHEVKTANPLMNPLHPSNRTVFRGTRDRFTVEVYEDVPFLPLPGVGQFAIIVKDRLLMFPWDRFYGAEIEGSMKDRVLESVMMGDEEHERFKEAWKKGQAMEGAGGPVEVG